MITVPADVMDAICDIQEFLDQAGLEDIRIEITSKRLYAQCRQKVRVKERVSIDG